MTDQIHPMNIAELANCSTPMIACVLEQGSAHILESKVPRPGIMQFRTIRTWLSFKLSIRQLLIVVEVVNPENHLIIHKLLIVRTYVFNEDIKKVYYYY